jgi:hypothetical protein
MGPKWVFLEIQITTISNNPYRTISTSNQPVVVQAEVDDLGLTGCGASFCCDPRSRFHRFIALVLMCLLGFGSYFCFDNPGALQVLMIINSTPHFRCANKCLISIFVKIEIFRLLGFGSYFCFDNPGALQVLKSPRPRWRSGTPLALSTQ